MVDPSTGAVLFPFRTVAMLAGLLTSMAVSRLTAMASPPTPLPGPESPATPTG